MKKLTQEQLNKILEEQKVKKMSEIEPEETTESMFLRIAEILLTTITMRSVG